MYNVIKQRLQFYKVTITCFHAQFLLGVTYSDCKQTDLWFVHRPTNIVAVADNNRKPTTTSPSAQQFYHSYLSLLSE